MNSIPSTAEFLVEVDDKICILCVIKLTLGCLSSMVQHVVLYKIQDAPRNVQENRCISRRDIDQTFRVKKKTPNLSTILSVHPTHMLNVNSMDSS